MLKKSITLNHDLYAILAFNKLKKHIFSSKVDKAIHLKGSNIKNE